MAAAKPDRLNLGGGRLHTRYVEVGTTRTLISRTNSPNLGCQGMIVQQRSDSTVDVYIGGADVVADATPTVGDPVGYLLPGTPNTTPATPPAEFPQTITSQEVYAVTLSGTAKLVVLEVY
jgi:hypothetical protein